MGSPVDADVAGGPTTITQLAMTLARVFEGAVVSMTGCSAADDVPSLKAMWVDEFGIGQGVCRQPSNDRKSATGGRITPGATCTC